MLGVLQPSISRHLAYLVRSDLVTARPVGKWKYYAIIDEPDGLGSDLISCLRSCLADVDVCQADRTRLEGILKRRDCCRHSNTPSSNQPAMMETTEMNTHKKIVETVRSRYAEFATSGRSSQNETVHSVAEGFGYDAEQLASIPAEANMALSCGNPVAQANLQPGEVVVDLGCGGGLDVFLAAKKVGADGKVIGIDMTAEMIDLARGNAVKFGQGAAPGNVEFHLATIDQIPLADASVDCVISNCVINLAPDKKAVFRDAFRVLKPGGRFVVSDIALKKPLPPEVKDDVAAYTGCLAGATTLTVYEKELIEAGFADVQIMDSQADLNAYRRTEGSSCGCSAPKTSTDKSSPNCCSGDNTQAADDSPTKSSNVLDDFDVNVFAASVSVLAMRPE